jgi:hypothetical protein
LLTFWPPGPDARAKVSVSSRSSMRKGPTFMQIP